MLMFLRTRSNNALLRQLTRLRGIEEKLEAIETAVKAMRSVPLLDQLSGIREDLSAVLARFERTEAAVPVAIEAAPRATPGELVRDRIEAKLYGMGYERVHILTDLSGAGPLDAIKVAVECVRDDIAHKGTVALKNGAVMEVKLYTVLQAFP